MGTSRKFILAAAAFLCIPLWAMSATDILDVMKTELDRSMANLGQASEAPLYYLQYAITERHAWEVEASNGGLESPQRTNRRYLDVDVRVGSMKLDNTHRIRGGSWGDNYSFRRAADFPIGDDASAMRAALWNETEQSYRRAQERLLKVLTNKQVKVQEEDQSDDFSPESAQTYTEPVTLTAIDSAHWLPIVKRVGQFLAGFPFVQESSVRLAADDLVTYMVNSEGSRLQHVNHYVRLILNVSATADDGMELERYATFNSASPEKLPQEPAIMADAQRLVDELRALKSAPVVEPYIGPAILMNRASGVFFHEIFGHRIEGHRQKDEEGGQTFTKKVNEEILPDFISVYDDPTQAEFKGIDLRGHYKFDDEGTPAQRVPVVEKGVLKNFLTTRSPIDKFPTSNGHARRSYGRDAVARQGNLMVHSDKTVSFPKLRQMLVDECRKQGKPYGLIFYDISGGFTNTDRGGPQAFKVIPLLVSRVYSDGRPDEVVRGVDIVGTPLTSFSKVVMAADDDDVFNGTCGAESGWVPVSAVSPSLLVTEIEVEKKEKGQEKPPILPPPGSDESTGVPSNQQMRSVP